MKKELNKDEKLSIFSKRLKIAREAKNFTQEELAKKLKIQNTTISKYENMKNSIEKSNAQGYPYLQTAYEIAIFLDCSLDWLVGLSDINKPQTEIYPNGVEKEIEKETQFLIDTLEDRLTLYKTDENSPFIIPKEWINNDISKFFENYKKRCTALENLEEDSDIDKDLIESLKNDVVNKFIKNALNKYNDEEIEN